MAKIDDLMEECAQEFRKEEQPECPLVIKQKEEKKKLIDFFFKNRAKPVNKNPNRHPIATQMMEMRRLQGNCPECGKPGRIHLSAFVCEEHGEF